METLAKFLIIPIVWGLVHGATNSPPVLEQTYTFTVSESLDIGSHVGRITAIDTDGPQELEFAIDSPETNNLIYLSSAVGDSTTGRSVDMILKAPLDRESENTYHLAFTVTDGDNTVKFTVSIFVSDVNDNAPQFVVPSYSATVDSTVLPGTRVLTVFATDPDGGSGGVIQYSLKSDDQEALKFFYINFFAGLVETKAPLLTKTDHVFHMQAVAKDGGHLSTAVNITIRVLPQAVPTLPPMIKITPLVG